MNAGKLSVVVSMLLLFLSQSTSLIPEIFKEPIPAVSAPNAEIKEKRNAIYSQPIYITEVLGMKVIVTRITSIRIAVFILLALLTAMWQYYLVVRPLIDFTILRKKAIERDIGQGITRLIKEHGLEDVRLCIMARSGVRAGRLIQIGKLKPIYTYGYSQGDFGRSLRYLYFKLFWIEIAYGVHGNAFLNESELVVDHSEILPRRFRSTKRQEKHTNKLAWTVSLPIVQGSEEHQRSVGILSLSTTDKAIGRNCFAGQGLEAAFVLSYLDDVRDYLSEWLK